MGYLSEPAREIPIVDQYDICVIGGGCTGVFAAIRAARLGAKVAIIENQGFFGGTATASLTNVWHSLKDSEGQMEIVGGLTLEVIERLDKRGALIYRDPENAPDYYVFNSAELAIELDELLVQEGVRPFLHSRFVNAITQKDGIEAAIIEDKTGRRALEASYFIDATGDAALVAKAGLECYKRPQMQPATSCAILNLPEQIPSGRERVSIRRLMAKSECQTDLPSGFIWWAPVPGPGESKMIAGTRISADCSDADQLTKAEMEGRRQIRALCSIIQENLPRNQMSPLVALPSRIGIRETRHARCLHRLTQDEVLGGVQFDDAVANGSYRVDIHLNDRPGVIFRYLDGREVLARPNGERETGRWKEIEEDHATFYQIPYASLVPRKAVNLLVCGRCMDADRGAFGAVRVMVNCNQTGEAAGTACYLALQSNKPVGDVDQEELRDTMARNGSVII